MTPEAELTVGMVALVWGVTAVILALLARTRRTTRRLRCPLLRRTVEVEGHEWNGRWLDVRRCSGLEPPTDFGLCDARCLELEEPADAAG